MDVADATRPAHGRVFNGCAITWVASGLPFDMSAQAEERVTEKFISFKCSKVVRRIVKC